MAHTVTQRDGQWFLDIPDSSVKCETQSEAEALCRALGRAEHYEHEPRPLAVTESVGDLDYAVWLLQKYDFKTAARCISAALAAAKKGDDLDD